MRRRSVFRRFFHPKKIVVVSDERIFTVRLTTPLQWGLVTVLFVSLVWVSYSSGQYFAYEQTLSVKDRELEHTSLANASLQYKMHDLHQSLVKLDDYLSLLESFDYYEHGTFSRVQDGEVDDGNAVDVASDDEVHLLPVMSRIHDRLRSRIDLLESVVQKTGLNMKELKRDNALLRDSAKLSYGVYGGGQGGPFISVENDSEVLRDPVLFQQLFQKDMDYLVALERLVGRLPLARPMSEGYISSRFGYRIDPVHKTRAMHKGIDFVGAFKSKIRSTATGVVRVARRKGAYGKYIEIDHGMGVYTRYGHLSKIMVRRGQRVSRGDVIGLQGNTGRSTGAHLHYEVRYKGRALDPLLFLEAGKDVFS